jgi:uncharacterized protein YgbK (DUF1537 family)
MGTHRSYLQILSDYASLSCESLRKEISEALKKESIKLVVLDDDPTGIQTVHDCLLLTNWRPENLLKAFNDESPIFYVLTNTRSMTAEVAESVTLEAATAIVECNRKQGFKLIFISRSDSTLRGHFPLEPDTIRQVLESDQLPVLASTFFIPAFFEAGRYTIEGTHYLKDKDQLIPVSETEFAADNVFGYHHSDLKAYITEKAKGQVEATEIGSLSLEELRRNSLPELVSSLKKQSGKPWIIVDALGYDDLWKFSAALLSILAETDTNAVMRTSSSLPKALSGMSDKPLLNRSDLISKGGVGLFIVGSHVKKSSSQLSVLLESKQTKGIELDVNRILQEPDALIISTIQELKAVKKAKLTPVIYTSRKELRSNDATERLLNGSKISDFLVRIVQELPFQPAYLVAKGGITAHDILTKGLGIETATVAGQILPGVPALKTASDHRFPNMPYLIFPGNVGEVDALKHVLEMLA